MEYKKWTEEQKIAHVLDALSREDLSPEIAELIQEWILCGEDNGRKDETLDAILDSMFMRHPDPSQRSVESLARMHERLGFPGGDAPGEDAEAGKRVPLRRIMLRVAAVSLTLALVGGAVWFALRQVPEPHVVMTEVTAGEDGVVVLPDGSTVRLLEGSHVTMAENFSESRLVALSGEAFFSVIADAGRPFSVEVDELTVTVLGTEFNIKSLSDENETVISLVTGSVEVESDEECVVLAPMERLVYDELTGESVVETFSTEQIDRSHISPAP